MSFEVAAQSYGRFMGRWSERLAAELALQLDLADLADLADVAGSGSALDVGCGPGAMTAELVERLGAHGVAAVDPSEPFVTAARSAFPGVDVRRAGAEDLPFEDDRFDVTVALLVVHFMTDPVRGLAEMARVTRPGGQVAATVWDHGGGTGPLSPFWRAVTDLDPGATDESGLPGSHRGQLADLFERAGLEQVQDGVITVHRRFASAQEWWEPFTLGVGPAGDLVAGLDPDRREALRRRCAEITGPGPLELAASAWTVIGRSPTP